MFVQTQQRRLFQDRSSSGLSPGAAAANTPFSFSLIRIPSFYCYDEHLISNSEDDFISDQKINVYLQFTAVMETGKEKMLEKI